MNKKNIIYIIILIVLIILFYFFYNNKKLTDKALKIVEKNTVIFECIENKKIIATFYIGDDRFVDLTLSDGRILSVPKAISASGARYANTDESFVFWNKGDTAFITENNPEIQTFKDCIIKK